MEGSAERLEALDRKLQEIEALQAIYGEYDDENNSNGDVGGLYVVDRESLEKATQLIDGDSNERDERDAILAAPMDIQLHLPIELDDAGSSSMTCIQFHLPAHYPLVAAEVVIMSVEGYSRSEKESLSAALTQKAQELAETEAIMELIQAFQELVLETMQQKKLNGAATPPPATTNDADLVGLSRRWIWVHHIVDKGRCKDIVREANDIKLGGYLKPGYPGIVVIEGPIAVCDEYVSWIKGNKSRPGGFGRNWGHHVRGQVGVNEQMLSSPFEQLEPELSVLAEKMKELGLEEEFLAYVMQHTAS